MEVRGQIILGSSFSPSLWDPEIELRLEGAGQAPLPSDPLLIFFALLELMVLSKNK